MAAFNIVRFRVKQGRVQEFLQASHIRADVNWPGLKHANIIRADDPDLLHHCGMERHGPRSPGNGGSPGDCVGGQCGTP
jgi:hypothetical protein